MEKGFKFNHTAKERALRLLEKERKEKQDHSNYLDVMSKLNIEVII